MIKTDELKKLKIALVYDRINKWGGAERILLLLRELFPDADIYTSVADRKKAAWAKDLPIKTSFLQRIKFARSHHELFALVMPLSFEAFSFDEYDVVISLTSEAAKGIITKPQTKHICINLTPTRYLWSGVEIYFPHKFTRLLLWPVLYYLRKWDVVAASRPDIFLAISKTVQNRIKKYYKRTSVILYPPLFLEPKNIKTDDKGFFLVVSRLSRFTPHKKVELAIQACNTLQLPLKVVGDGDIAYFKSIAGPSVQILGKATDEKLKELYANCTALIFPGTEDFGLVMVEAQSFGKPIIAHKSGGATEIVTEGKTGMFFSAQTARSLESALKTFDRSRYNEKDCQKSAQRFTKEIFVRNLMIHIENALRNQHNNKMEESRYR